jgi:radical SAM protein with 4Fe4S-binding SPASM domain
MQGRKEIVPKMLYHLSINDLVESDNYYRKLDAAFDWRFLYKSTEKYYGTEGNASIDPVVFFKICLVGYLNNINSDRRLINFCSNALDIRLFIRYDLDEALPWHSTISRTRQLYGEEVFLQLFKQVLALCIEKEMVGGKRQALDSAYVKANASLDSLQEKSILDDVEQYTNELNEHSEFKISPPSLTPKDKAKEKVTTQKNTAVEQHHNWKKEAYKDMPGHGKEDREDEHGNLIRPKYLSNHTHFSPTDSDARISVKPGKARQLNYFAQVAVDTTNHVITAAGADFADKRDSECLVHIVNQIIENLAENDLKLNQLLADTGFSSGTALKFCEDNNIDAYIPNFGLYKPMREGFIYNEELDQFECQRGNLATLPFRKIKSSHDKHEMKVYRSNNSKCKDCPLRSSCIGKSDFKKIEHSIYKPQYDAMHAKLQTAKAKRLMRKRGSTVEPVLGTMLNFLNLKRVNTRGIKQANKHVMMSALTYNLKKYLKFISRKTVTKAQSMSIEIEQKGRLLFLAKRLKLKLQISP